MREVPVKVLQSKSKGHWHKYETKKIERKKTLARNRRTQREKERDSEMK